MANDDRAIIIGAGVAGLTTAIALRRAGIDATVYEASSELREIGAGLGVQYGAVKALREIGLGDEILRIGQPMTLMRWTTWDGKPLATIPHAEIGKRLGVQTLNVHRGDLLNVLVHALGRDRIVLGARFVDFEEDEHGATVTFEDGRTARGPLLVGADGARSRVRARALGDGDPRPTYMVVWRSMPAFRHEKAPLGVLRQAYGPGKLFSLVPGTESRVFWFACGLVSEFGGRAEIGPKQELEPAFAGWAPPVGELLAATDANEIARTRIFDRSPVDRWGTRRVTLAGDAAHPMMPTLGQGASTGIEDAAVLARHLSRLDTLADAAAVETTLRAYEKERIGRTSPLVRNARMFAPIAMASNPVTCRLRDTFLRLTPAGTWQRRLRRQHSYEPGSIRRAGTDATPAHAGPELQE